MRSLTGQSMKTIIPGKNTAHLQEAVDRFAAASHAVALTGAGISVNSGIADFRSPGGVWTIFSPNEYATLDVFRRQPEKAWKLYRAMGKDLLGKQPNNGHRVLAALEERGLLQGIVTQNVDNLHQSAGSKNVLEIHGDHQHLQCLECGDKVAVVMEHYSMAAVPHCTQCDYPYKPNVVLFGEEVRQLDRVEQLIRRSDLLLVIGTSAQIYPAAGLPAIVKQNGGLIFEFNQKQELSTSPFRSNQRLTDYFFSGDLAATLPLFGNALGC